MFEKEAEEYLIRNLCKTCLTICENNCPHAESEKRAFKDGAEFGYNKANEWHYTKDGNLPEVDNRIVLCICSDGYIDENKHYILKLLTKKEFPLFQPVYAWKEITLPKEIKQND